MTNPPQSGPAAANSSGSNPAATNPLLRARSRHVARPALAAVLVDGAALLVMIMAAGLALGPAYGGAGWAFALGGGALVGIVAGALPILLRWPALSTVAVAIVGYLAVGPAIATPSSAIVGVLPSLESVRLLALGVVSGWKQMLTVADPVGTAGGLLIPAMLIGLVTGAVGMCVAGRARHPLWALAGPALVLVAAGALGTVRDNLPLVAGLVVLVVALTWGAWKVGRFGSSGIDLHRPFALGISLVAAVAAALFATPLVAPDAPRDTLRNVVDLHFDPEVYPSPLGAFRRYVRTDAKDAMFTVTGLPKGDRIRLATMDSYNGLLYNVSNDAGAFTGVGDIVRSDTTGTDVSLDVTVKDYAGVWLPDIGSMTGIDFGGSRSSRLAGGLRYSAATGTAVVTAGLKTGDSYRLSAVVPPAPDKSTLETLAPGTARIGDTSRVPSTLTAAAAAWTENKDTAYDKVEAIRSALASRGLLDHGDRLASPSGHGYDRLQRLMTDKDMVGDQEQFAPAMALMVQSLGIPARVVMGFAPTKYRGTGPVTITGADVTAWVEVDFENVGWVAFDPTPQESRVQQPPTPKPEAAQRQQVLQPPPPPRVPRDADATDVDQNNTEDKNKDKDKHDDAVTSGGVPWVAIGSIGGPVLVVLVPLGVILLLKLRQRRRRGRGSAADQISGGWELLLDGAVDLGAGLPAKRTRTETAAALDRHFGGNSAALAYAADARIFGPGDPTADDVDRYRASIGEALGGMRGSVSRWRRIRAAVSTTSLRRGRRGKGAE